MLHYLGANSSPLFFFSVLSACPHAVQINLTVLLLIPSKFSHQKEYVLTTNTLGSFYDLWKYPPCNLCDVPCEVSVCRRDVDDKWKISLLDYTMFGANRCILAGSEMPRSDSQLPSLAKDPGAPRVSVHRSIGRALSTWTPSTKNHLSPMKISGKSVVFVENDNSKGRTSYEPSDVETYLLENQKFSGKVMNVILPIFKRIWTKICSEVLKTFTGKYARLASIIIFYKRKFGNIQMSIRCFC